MIFSGCGMTGRNSTSASSGPVSAVAAKVSRSWYSGLAMNSASVAWPLAVARSSTLSSATAPQVSVPLYR